MGRFDEWLWKAGIDVRWFRAAAARQRAARIGGDLPTHGLNDRSPAGVREDVDRPTLSGRYAASDEDEKGGARSPASVHGEKRQTVVVVLTAAVIEAHMRFALGLAPKRLAGMPIPEAKTRPVSFPARRLRVIEGGRHAAPDAIGP